MGRLRLVKTEIPALEPDATQPVDDSQDIKFEQAVIDDIDSVPTVSSRRADIATARALHAIFDKYIQS